MTLLTGKQAYVLENLERVRPHPYKIAIRSPVKRFQIDGWECTTQIIGLVVKNLVREQSGAVQRIEGSSYSVRYCDLARTERIEPARAIG